MGGEFDIIQHPEIGAWSMIIIGFVFMLGFAILTPLVNSKLMLIPMFGFIIMFGFGCRYGNLSANGQVADNDTVMNGKVYLDGKAI